MIDLESIRQRAQKEAAFCNSPFLFTWREVLELVEEIDNLQQELEAAEDDIDHESIRADRLESEVENLESKVDDLKIQVQELEQSSNCKDCGYTLKEDLCVDCFHTGGR